MAQKKIYQMNVTLKAEIRKAVIESGSFQNKKGETVETKKIVLSVDDTDDSRIYLTDRNLDRLDMYQKGTVGTFHLRLDVDEEFGSRVKITVTDFVPDKSKK